MSISCCIYACFLFAFVLFAWVKAILVDIQCLCTCVYKYWKSCVCIYACDYSDLRWTYTGTCVYELCVWLERHKQSNKQKLKQITTRRLLVAPPLVWWHAQWTWDIMLLWSTRQHVCTYTYIFSKQQHKQQHTTTNTKAPLHTYMHTVATNHYEDYQLFSHRRCCTRRLSCIYVA